MKQRAASLRTGDLPAVVVETGERRRIRHPLVEVADVVRGVTLNDIPGGHVRRRG